ncbi:MAG: GAF domain-containing protein [Plectolyngbya sp. WJT66-NPBG17]|jgi:GAF domain-containing protein|nr:GAF domain-containing protein [Plectolyngbya sp. WJT66-NPBG17]MBW4526575.1 GAF domain-containing protein [Phormidium tanganyikae FI6-MK23]
MSPEIAELLKTNSAHALPELMEAIAQCLNTDRCFLYLRDPKTRLGRVPFCWTRSREVPTVYDEDWKPEPESLPDEDPMFAAALATKPSIFVEDVTTASSDVLNAEFERENFGHRALIHGHLCYDDQLWGVLQPCLMNQSRVWTDEERSIFSQIVDKITPIAVQYIEQQAKNPPEE